MRVIPFGIDFHTYFFYDRGRLADDTFFGLMRPLYKVSANSLYLKFDLASWEKHPCKEQNCVDKEKLEPIIKNV